MNIGDVSRESGVSTKMIRYYEEIGLIPAAHRTEAGYRTYSDKDVHQLRFIRRARDLGFSVTQLAELLTLWSDGHRASADVKRIARQHIAELEHKIQELRAMTDALKHLAEHCHGDHRPECPILEDLAGAVEVEARHMDLTRFGAGGVDPVRRKKEIH
ncbi:Cu(I)-responsive transcriptional regulator [Sinorhizobium saheli]|uniref:Transcriptional regulator n=1 Tax=Sinorhizobium saheli TaxID=36856 RepID=A0A178XWM6_SINSA|nr:Cu(I)-responsive transcriptional regulator [Sinorhizobium saheli]MQW87717.1 Cu(I)-responsive transcriptional regulator [Sinorhizobium saheli]OAP39544.1 transcriptional regulator [Sinorhizobium saheli]